MASELLILSGIDAYRDYFEKVYCSMPITTFDGIRVRFRKRDFDHCCYESDRETHIKSTFSILRAERLGWIRDALNDKNADVRVGWNSALRKYDHQRRVCIISGNYIVVISLLKNSPNMAEFITAYLANSDRTMQLIKKSPKWSTSGT